MEKIEPRKRVTKKRSAPTWKEQPKAMFAIGLLIGLGIIGGLLLGGDDGLLKETIFDDEDEDEGGPVGYTSDFGIGSRTWRSNGSNEFFILEPGFQIVLEGEDDGETIKVQITVLNETRMVNGIECRVVEESEWEDGEIVEVSRNWFAIDVETNSVFYFGESVDDYKDGVISGHGGEWEAGTDGAKAGLMMPGLVLLGSAYYQEYYPGEAMDRAVNVAVDVTRQTPLGTFTGCLKVKESNPLTGEEPEYKYHAPGIGLIQDEEAKLVSYGYI